MRRMLIGAAMLALAAPAMAQGGQHWGGRVGGYWVGGVHAPGGYRTYRRPVKGLALPTYWLSPSFRVADWHLYGLTPPTPGAHWARYYDDAVLIDDRGTVVDAIEGVDWDLHDLDMQMPAYAVQPSPPMPPAPPLAGAPYPPPPHHAAGDAVAGAAIGGAAGAIAGGRHDRLGGALIGGGVGAVAGYAIGRDTDRRAGADYPPPPPEAYDPPPGAYPPAMAYAPPPPDFYGPPPRHHHHGDEPEMAYAPPPPMMYAPPLPPVQRYEVAGGSTTVITTGGAGCGCGWGGGVTTVVVQNPTPVSTTTTTTEYVEQPAVRYRTYTTYRRVPTKLVRVVRYTKTRGKLQPVKRAAPAKPQPRPARK